MAPVVDKGGRQQKQRRPGADEKGRHANACRAGKCATQKPRSDGAGIENTGNSGDPPAPNGKRACAPQRRPDGERRRLSAAKGPRRQSHNGQQRGRSSRTERGWARASVGQTGRDAASPPRRDGVDTQQRATARMYQRHPERRGGTPVPGRRGMAPPRSHEATQEARKTRATAATHQRRAETGWAHPSADQMVRGPASQPLRDHGGEATTGDSGDAAAKRKESGRAQAPARRRGAPPGSHAGLSGAEWHRTASQPRRDGKRERKDGARRTTAHAACKVGGARHGHRKRICMFSETRQTPSGFRSKTGCAVRPTVLSVMLVGVRPGRTVRPPGEGCGRSKFRRFERLGHLAMYSAPIVIETRHKWSRSAILNGPAMSSPSFPGARH